MSEFRGALDSAIRAQRAEEAAARRVVMARCPDPWPVLRALGLEP